MKKFFLVLCVAFSFCLADSQESEFDTIWALNKAGQEAHSKDDYEQALEYYKLAFELSKKVLGKEDPRTSAIYYNICNSYMGLKNYNMALVCLHESSDMMKNITGEDSAMMADVYNRLGKTYLSLKNASKAFKYYEKSLNIRKNIPEEKDSIGMADDYFGIGAASLGLRKEDEVVKYLSESLRIYENRLGANDAKTIVVRKVLEEVKEKIKQ